MRLTALFAALLLAGCAPTPVKPLPAETPAAEAWYGEAVRQLNLLNRQAEDLLRSRKTDQTAALITKGQPIMTRLLSVRRPTLAALEAASDLDDLYGRMLLSNRHYGWARMLFQKNLARWTNCQPQTAETARRRKLAESEIAECDRRIME